MRKKYIKECGKILLLIWSAFIVSSCANQSTISDVPISLGNSPEQPQEVTLCEVLGNPATFNHKLIKISGVVSRGFEVFTLTDGSCHNFNAIWLELGGLRGSGVIYCCGDNKIEKRREKPLVVEGIKTQLIEDEMLSRFETLTNQRHEYGKAKLVVEGIKTQLEDEMLSRFETLTNQRHEYGDAKVELVGRYFSGKQRTIRGRTLWMGYGHLGMGSLLVIQQVLSVSKP